MEKKNIKKCLKDFQRKKILINKKKFHRIKIFKDSKRKSKISLIQKIKKIKIFDLNFFYQH